MWVGTHSLALAAASAFLLHSSVVWSALLREAERLDMCSFKEHYIEDFTAFHISARSLEGGARWIAHTPWNGDFGDAAFVDPGPKAPFSIADGELQISATKNETGKWTSGLIAAADGAGRGTAVRYGYFEARMRLPPGPGTWPAFWLMTLAPRGDPTPGVELDVLEYYGHMDGKFSSAVHVWYRGDDAKKKSRHTLHWTSVPAGSLVDRFHDYGVRVLPQEITFFLNRREIWRQPTPPELDKPLFPLANLALGSGYPITGTPDPSVLRIQRIGIYEFDPGGAPTRCPESTSKGGEGR